DTAPATAQAAAPASSAAAEAPPDPTAAATRHATGAEEPDAGRRRTRGATEATGAAATTAAEELVQHVRQVDRLGVLDRVDEGLSAGTLVGRDVEELEPAFHLGEGRFVVRDHD